MYASRKLSMLLPDAPAVALALEAALLLVAEALELGA